MEARGERAHPLRFGTAFHAGLEVWWRSAGDLELALGALLASAEGEDLGAFDAVKAVALLKGYHARWVAEPLVVLAVEHEFSLPLTNPTTGADSRTFRRAGKFDGFVRDEAGDHWVVEHKTSSDDIQPGSAYWQMLRMDTQVSTYLDAAELAFGVPVVGVLYDVIGKPGLKPYKATPEDKRKYKKDGSLYANMRAEDEAADAYGARVFEDIAANPGSYYQRGAVVRMEAESREALADLWQTARAIRDAERLRQWPRNPDACRAYNRLCQYFPVCSGEADIADGNRFQKKQAHPELNHVTGEQP